jgi:hypothetical protein
MSLSSSANPANAGKSSGATAISRALSASGIKSAAKVSGDANADGNNVQTGTEDRGNTKNYTGATTANVSAERSAGDAVSRFSSAISNAGIMGARLAAPPFSGGPTNITGMGAGADSIGAGVVDIAKAWSGLGASKKKPTASSGSYSNKDRGSGGEVEQNQNQNQQDPPIQNRDPNQNPNPNSQPNPNQNPNPNSQPIPDLESNIRNGGLGNHKALESISNAIKSNDKAFLVKVGSESCPPCRSWDASDKSSLEANYGYMKVDQPSQPELAKALQEASGTNASGIPAFYRVHKDENGALKVEFIQSGASGGVAGLKAQMDAKEASKPHNTQEKLQGNLDQARQQQIQQSTQQLEARNQNLSEASKLFGEEDSAKLARETFADMKQIVGKNTEGGDKNFASSLSNDAKEYYVKENEDGTRSLSANAKQGFEKVSFSDIKLPNTEENSITTKQDFHDRSKELYDQNKANEVNQDSNPNQETEHKKNTELLDNVDGLGNRSNINIENPSAETKFLLNLMSDHGCFNGACYSPESLSEIGYQKQQFTEANKESLIHLAKERPSYLDGPSDSPRSPSKKYDISSEEENQLKQTNLEDIIKKGRKDINKLSE